MKFSLLIISLAYVLIPSSSFIPWLIHITGLLLSQLQMKRPLRSLRILKPLRMAPVVTMVGTTVTVVGIAAAVTDVDTDMTATDAATGR
jgi:hypothetical protein